MTSVNAKHEALLDELLKDYTDPQDILGEHGLQADGIVTGEPNLKFRKAGSI